MSQTRGVELREKPLDTAPLRSDSLAHRAKRWEHAPYRESYFKGETHNGERNGDRAPEEVRRGLGQSQSSIGRPGEPPSSFGRPRRVERTAGDVPSPDGARLEARPGTPVVRDEGSTGDRDHAGAVGRQRLA